MHHEEVARLRLLCNDATDADRCYTKDKSRQRQNFVQREQGHTHCQSVANVDLECLFLDINDFRLIYSMSTPKCFFALLIGVPDVCSLRSRLISEAIST